MPFLIDQPEPLSGSLYERINSIHRSLEAMTEVLNRNFDELRRVEEQLNELQGRDSNAK